MSDEASTSRVTEGLTLLGRPVRGSIGPEAIETIASAPGINEIAFVSNELTALCPMTEQPDVYSIRISYRPRERAIEHKSLKLYLFGFRNRGIFAEHLAAEVAQDLASVVDVPVRVQVTQQPRGGLSLEVDAEGTPRASSSS
ncbi:preQ(1) synthase [Streptomyces xantholiticus]|uniref:preQ(1) synthase n=1 Tax=Streptomyces xantholiticus TaxID=68285 RepID=UPI001674AD08|nr:NADPH-dependent 7-cyano-7-deazaguanine reductase [Streptomyces xantholiticus]GGW65155.1 NADPH-dependent 7-cyano-7-deazaguanine reductase [Streptomyces xantholiticus]